MLRVHIFTRFNRSAAVKQTVWVNVLEHFANSQTTYEHITKVLSKQICAQITGQTWKCIRLLHKVQFAAGLTKAY